MKVRVQKFFCTIERYPEDKDAVRIKLFRDMDLPALPAKGMLLYLAPGIETIEAMAYKESERLFYARVEDDTIWAYAETRSSYDPLVLRAALDKRTLPYFDAGWKVAVGRRHWKPKEGI